MDSNGSFYVLVSLQTSIRVLMGPYGSLSTLMDSNGSLWVLVGLYSFLSIPKGPYGSLYFLMRLYGF